MPQQDNTPAAQRFLKSNRPPAPIQTPATSRPVGAQFQATPRFALSSTVKPSDARQGFDRIGRPERPSPAPFPFATATTRPSYGPPLRVADSHRDRQADPIHDSFDASSPIRPTQPAVASALDPVGTQETIVPESPIVDSQVSIVAETPGPGTLRASKRRKISISSLPPSPVYFEPDTPSVPRLPGRDLPQDPLMFSSPPVPRGGGDEDMLDISSQEEDDNEDDIEDLELPQKNQRTRPHTQTQAQGGRQGGNGDLPSLFRPGDKTRTTRLGGGDTPIGLGAVFRGAPKFKPNVKEEAVPRDDDHRDSFSPPRRKGEKYIPGGLAAEVRQWIVEAQASFRGGGEVIVREVGESRGLLLVRGVVPTKGLEVDETPGGPVGVEVMVMLPGSGGGGEGTRVEVGSRVVVYPPVWDVNLDRDVWKVACNWTLGGRP